MSTSESAVRATGMGPKVPPSRFSQVGLLRPVGICLESKRDRGGSLGRVRGGVGVGERNVCAWRGRPGRGLVSAHWRGLSQSTKACGDRAHGDGREGAGGLAQHLGRNLRVHRGLQSKWRGGRGSCQRWRYVLVDTAAKAVTEGGGVQVYPEQMGWGHCVCVEDRVPAVEQKGGGARAHGTIPAQSRQDRGYAQRQSAFQKTP